MAAEIRLMGNRMHIEDPVEEVFDFMADCGNEADWNPDIKSVRRVGAGPVGPGAEWEGVYRGMGSMRVRIESYERPDLLGFSTTGRRLDMQFTFRYFAAGDATDITVDAVMVPKGLMRLAAPLVGPMMRRTMSRRPAQLTEGLRRRKVAGSNP